MQTHFVRPKRIANIIMILSAIALFSGCFWQKPKYIIPLQDNADEQFYYATRQHRKFTAAPGKQKLNPRAEGEPSMTERQQRLGDIALAAYRKVIEEFPDETLHVNRAYLGIARVKDEMANNKQALEIYRDLIEQVPNDDVVQVHSLFYAARILDQQKKYEQADEYYRRLIDRYQNTENPQFAKLVMMAAQEYEKVGRR
ncbi:MAG: tetratricopeptide repeat protein [Candidatus Sumerlaeota bacterium]